MNDQEAATLFLTAITLGEIGHGLEMLPRGERRLQLEQGFQRVIAEAFAGRILVFDEAAARHYGALMGRRKEIGRSPSPPSKVLAVSSNAPGAVPGTALVSEVLRVQRSAPGGDSWGCFSSSLDGVSFRRPSGRCRPVVTCASQGQ